MPTIFSTENGVRYANTYIRRFDGGITNDPRNPAENVARMVSNFDVLTSPRKMTPYRSSESGEDTAARNIRHFALAIRTGTTYALYGLGRTSAASNVMEVYYKNLTTGSDDDLDDAIWAETANNVSSSGAPAYNLFVYYQKTGYLYGSRAGTHIWRYDPDGTDAFVDAHQALTYSEIGQGIVHSKDDILYIPYFNSGGFIAKNDNGSWNTTALTLPKHYVPTSICEWGNYLAIGCAHSDGVSNSRIFLWDRNETTPILAESMDAGSGLLIILEEIDGELIAISQKGGRAGSFGLFPRSSIAEVVGDRVIFRRLSGNSMVKVLEIQANHSGSANTTRLNLHKQKVDNRLWFQLLCELNGSVRDGLWSFGRSGHGEPFSLIHERTSNNNTALTTSTDDDVRGFFILGDYVFQAYTTATTFAISKTDNSATFSHNSVWESPTFDAGDASLYKDLKEAIVQTEDLPSAGQVVLAYQVDENIGSSSWTTIFTNSTDDSISHTAMNIESSGAVLPKSYKQIAFRILSSGGAVVTGLTFKEQILPRRHIAD